ncbi:sporulation protein Cse60 [Enterococcus avium]|uniref:sporulation protein Cse60 n=1 Tax=Enterococcus avium TaxID=33945 RepID=UPI0023311099|nr:sporulation protein Cse60 [Enterococcus avium]MDB1728763.1 sporulation protein Cse60 [Enterococcus avium]MDB1732852.1 sporulation protein Cse60 [Enterococcus avium]MDT2379345.1 sporulation protein Cse60 [Enterococcus avium]MDT2488717.1 sporulation protein Cse60 [Enterococcus avium]MDT2491628.1 sporulation protein Cse60 [Enterococcus avium]
MKRVKYFDEENPMKLEREINEFLSETEVTYVDMKFQSEKSSEGYGEEILFSVFLVYEEPEKGQ